MRIFRLIATPVLLLGLLLLLIWGAFWGWSNLTAPLPPPEPTPCVTEEVDAVKPEHVYVRVYNGGFTSGLAYRESQRLEQDGFHIVTTGNTDERITETIIRANKDSEPGVELVESRFKDATVEYDDRIDGTIDILVGSDFGGKGKKPKKKVETEGTICIPPPDDTDPTAPAPEPTKTD